MLETTTMTTISRTERKHMAKKKTKKRVVMYEEHLEHLEKAWDFLESLFQNGRLNVEPGDFQFFEKLEKERVKIDFDTNDYVGPKE